MSIYLYQKDCLLGSLMKNQILSEILELFKQILKVNIRNVEMTMMMTMMAIIREKVQSLRLQKKTHLVTFMKPFQQIV